MEGNIELREEIVINLRSVADKFMVNNDPGSAFMQYLVVLELKPEWKYQLKPAITKALCDWGKFLEHEGRFDELFLCYQEALAQYPESEIILNNLGAHLCRLKQSKLALQYFQKALRFNNDYLPAYRNLQVARSVLVERWHFRMLNDSIRNRSFRIAIENQIKKGYDSVLDIGTGTGILSLFAKHAGAAKVYACDYSETMVSIATQVLDANLLTESIVVINKLSNELQIPEDIPERLSLVVTETFDAGLLGEHILETLIHAWENLLMEEVTEDGRPPERVLPKGAVLFITPVQCLSIARKNVLIKSNRVERNSFRHGIDFSQSSFTVYSDDPYDTENLKNISYEQLAPTHELFKFDFNNLSELKMYYSGEINKQLSIHLTDNGFIDALVVWFDLILDDEIFITSSPLSEKRCCWEQAIFLIKEERIARRNEILKLNSTCENGILSIDISNGNNEEQNTIFIPQQVMSFLNCESLLLTYLKIVDEVKHIFAGKTISVLDLSTFPYPGILMAQCSNANVFVSHPSSEIMEASKSIISSLNLDQNNINYLEWTDILLSEEDSKKFNIIFVDILDTTGIINEEMVVTIPLLRNSITSDGLFFPYKIQIWCQLIYSQDLQNSLQVNSSEGPFHIAEFINEYKVSQMIDFNINENAYEVITEPFDIGSLTLNNLNDEILTFDKEVEAISSGFTNAIIYWFHYNFSDNIDFSTSSPDSHISHGASLLDSPIQTEIKSVFKIQLKYASGVMKFEVAA